MEPERLHVGVIIRNILSNVKYLNRHSIVCTVNEGAGKKWLSFDVDLCLLENYAFLTLSVEIEKANV